MSRSDYHLYTKVPWDQTMRELRYCFEKWGVSVYNVWPQRVSDARADPRVIVEFTHPSGHQVSLTMERQPEARDNLRVLFLGLDAMRKNEKRGLGDVIGEAYLQLAAPDFYRDPYEVLGVRPDALQEIVDAAYRARARQLHPDTESGDEGAMKELNDAMERIKKERAALAEQP